jgi:hypothetical protein
MAAEPLLMRAELLLMRAELVEARAPDGLRTHGETHDDGFQGASGSHVQASTSLAFGRRC